MLRFFKKRSAPVPTNNSPAQGLIPIESAQILLSVHQPLLSRIQSMVGIPATHWSSLYARMFDSYAAYVQQLPASESHHHSDPGGLLRHGLEVVHEALRIRRGMLLPLGADAETLARLQDVWTYAAVSGALLHDLGKPLVDQQVLLFDASGRELELWQPMIGPMPESARQYRIKFRSGRRYHHHERVAPLVARWVVPLEGLAWLAKEPDLMDCWLNAIQGEWEQSGPLGEIIAKADSTSAAQDLAGGSRIQVSGARAKPLSQRLLTTLRHLLGQDQIPLNRRGAAGFVTEDALWLVSKRVLDQIRDQLAKDGQTGIPGRNDRLMDELQQNGVLLPCGDRAVWKCSVIEGDWSVDLTLLKLDLGQVWGDPERRPQPWAGQIQPLAVQDDSGDERDTSETSFPASANMPGAASIDLPPPRQSIEPVPPAVSVSNAQSFADLDDGLPLPFDLPSSLPVTESATLGTPQAEAVVKTEPQVEPATESVSEDPFLGWLQEAIRSGREPINTTKARMHVVPEGLLLVSPGIFKDYSLDEWDKAQKRFMKLRLHAKRADGTNIWTVAVAKPEGGRRTSTLKAILIPNAELQLRVKLPTVNPVLTLIK